LSPERRDTLIAGGLGLFSLVLYVRTLVPGLLPGDGGEFQTVAYTFDHAHTTGYHVYIVLAKLFTLLVPAGDIAYRVNLFSAAMAATTIALVYLAGYVVSGSRWGALIGALALAISGTFWSQSIIAEVYTLGSVFSAAILLLALMWYAGGSPWLLFTAGLLGGMGIGVHGTVVLLAPAVLFLVLLRWREGRRVFLPAGAGVLAGVLLLLAAFAAVDARTTYASILWTAYIPSISLWDASPGQMESMTGRFSFLVFAQQWRPAMFVDPENVVPNNLGRLAGAFYSDFSWLAQILVLVGLITLVRLNWRVGLFLIFAVIVHLYYTLNYRIHDIYVFFVSLYVYFAVLAAVGAGVLIAWTRRLPDGWGRAAPVILALAVLAVVVLPLAQSRVQMLQAQEARWDFMQLPTNRELSGWHTWIELTSERLPDDAVVLMDWHNLYGFVYATHVEQNRTGMLFMEASPYSQRGGVAETMITFLREQLEQGRPVYALYRIDELQRAGMRLSPVNVGGTNMFTIELR
jgi:hypothetical protein